MVKKKKVARRAKRVSSRPKKAVKRAKPVRPSAKKSKKVTGKGSARKADKTAGKLPESALEKIGEVTHYFPHVNAAAVLLLKDGLKVGDQIYLKGHTTDFKEKVESIQLDRVSIPEGKKGQEIGLLVSSRVRIGDSVYRI